MAIDLRPITEDWDSALAVVAHPDDIEYGAAAAVARWTAQGKRIAYCLATSGEAGIDTMPPHQAGPLRELEQRASAAVVGADPVDFLGHADGTLEYGLPLRRDLARAIRRHRPEVLIMTNHRETWESGIPNQADHIAIGRAAIDAARDAANRWVFQELLDEELEPWNGVRLALAIGSPVARHGVDVTGYFAKGVESLKAHSAYLAALGGGPMSDPESYLDGFLGLTGERFGTEYAVPFELIVLG